MVEVELVLVLGILSPLVTSAKAWPPSMWTQADSPEVSRKFCLGCSFLGPRSWGVGHFILLAISLFLPKVWWYISGRYVVGHIVI